MSAAASILLLSKNRFAEMGWLDLLKGEIITVSNFDLALTGGALAFVLLVLGLFSKELLFISFDRAMAATLGKSVLFWDALLYLLIGFTVSIAVLSVGPRRHRTSERERTGAVHSPEPGLRVVLQHGLLADGARL